MRTTKDGGGKRTAAIVSPAKLVVDKKSSSLSQSNVAGVHDSRVDDSETNIIVIDAPKKRKKSSLIASSKSLTGKKWPSIVSSKSLIASSKSTKGKKLPLIASSKSLSSKLIELSIEAPKLSSKGKESFALSFYSLVRPCWLGLVVWCGSVPLEGCSACAWIRSLKSKRM